VGWRDWRIFQRLDRLEDRALFPGPKLQPGEEIVWSARANRAQGGRAVGGKLYVTDRRMMFAPNRIEQRLKGCEWSCSVGAVREIGVKQRGGNPFSGGVRRRLRVALAEKDELFVVDDPHDAATELRLLLLGGG
jgi:hypothetical protein